LRLWKGLSLLAPISLLRAPTLAFIHAFSMLALLLQPEDGDSTFVWNTWYSCTRSCRIWGFTAEAMKSSISCDVTLCTPVEVSRCYKATINLRKSPHCMGSHVNYHAVTARHFIWECMLMLPSYYFYVRRLRCVPCVWFS
jgi:hypothetical protein